MLETLRRLGAYLLDDMARAEGLVAPAVGEPPLWLMEAAGDDDQAQAALDASIRSHDIAQSAVSGLQEKASSHLTFAMALVPFALAATALSLPPQTTPHAARIAAFVLFVVADVALVASLALAALASGLALGGGISVDRLGELADKMSVSAPGQRVAALKAAQAESLRYAAQVAYASGVRVAQDLYTARRFAVIALAAATVAIVVLVGFGGGLDAFRPAQQAAQT